MHASIDSAMLARAPLFAGMPAGGLSEVASAASAVRCMPGETLFGQDDPADAFFVLISGRVKIAQVTVEGHQVVLRYIGPGEVFGAVPLFTNTGYPAASIAVTDSMALRWDRATTHRLLQRYPSIVANALTIVGRRLHELQNRYRELATERVEQRVGRAILRLLEKAGHRERSGVQIAFPLSRQDIAEMTGTTLHTVSRILSEWEKRGVVQGGRMRVIIRDPAALARIADDLPPGLTGEA
ncbi:MAG TPA: Crp/Fnr family transcriptional regulator [Acetobacteraceae bacterium]|nr:Crp/Fnr family transcriptional regulator [Acetobacteraceae bacterium]